MPLTQNGSRYDRYIIAHGPTESLEALINLWPVPYTHAIWVSETEIHIHVDSRHDRTSIAAAAAGLSLRITVLPAITRC